ncbi:MAG TPA: DUF2292 domain-containing protein [Kiritimatiellia bacterium]|nr:DUF2292 domain-containing protein [Kiritimatiellia bacterium]
MSGTENRTGREEPTALRGQDETRIKDEILRAVRDVRFGSVEIVIHDSKVVQVERREKIRFQK